MNGWGNLFSIAAQTPDLRSPLPCRPFDVPQGPLQPLVLALQQVISETGAALEQEGSNSLGAYVVGLLQEATASG